MRKRDFKIFIDFDGTITLEDVGEAIFRKFAETKSVDKIIDDLLTDKISSRKCWDLLCESVGEIDKQKLDEFIDLLEVDPTFFSFVNFCNEHELELIVLSDGFDYYIDRIFERAKLSELTSYANHLEISEDGKMKPGYPFYNPATLSSANCKSTHIINHSADDDITIYIGDGNSDRDAAQYCDYIFAKDGLLKFCEKERISFYPFKDFDDVKKRLTDLLNKKNIKKRHQAELKRKSAYISE